jgi:hypothetical protein
LEEIEVEGMEQQGGKSSSKPLTDEQIAMEMLEKVAVYCIDSIALENEQIVADLAIIDAAIVSHGIDSWMSVWSVINILTDKTEIDKFINEVPPTSRFHRNTSAVQALVAALERWIKEELIGNQDSVVKAFNILTERRQQNLVMLGEDPEAL